MSSSLNKITLIGRLGKDPEVRSTGTGKTVTSFTVATSETHGKDADKKETTQWHKCVAWEKLGDIAGNYLKKGKQVFVEGKVTYREYTDKENVKKYITEIIVSNFVFLGSKEDGATAETSQEQKQNDETQKFGPGMNTGADSDVPF